MERADAVAELKLLEGMDLRPLADEYGVTVWYVDCEGQRWKNKGWAGQVLERYLGLPLNSARSPNFGTWELKLVSLRELKSGRLSVKETMQICMIDPVHVTETKFEESHLITKLRKMVVCARLWYSDTEESSPLVSVATFDLDDDTIIRQVKADYEEVRSTIRDSAKGFDGLTGSMGTLVQPRTKGRGHGSTSRAFYARTGFVKLIIGLEDK